MLGVIGDVVQDIVVRQLEPQRTATDTTSQIIPRRGGSAANVAAFAASRYPTRFIGCVGDDLSGRVLRADLESHGLDVRLQVCEGSADEPGATVATGMVVLLVDEQGERTMFPSRGASTQLTHIDAAWLADLQILHVTAYSFESGPTAQSVLDAVRRQHDRGGLVSFDVSSTGLIEHFGIAAFHDLVQETRPDFLTANEAECRMLGLAVDGEPGPALAYFDGAIVLARRGSAATTVLRDGAVLARVPVPPVHDVQDVTGAGDAFNAGFLTAYLTNAGDVMRSCEAGHALAARVVRSPGATEER